jgi:hypothetical protein
MASESNPPCQTSLGEEPHQQLIPTRTSSISRNLCMGDPRILNQVVSAAPTSGSTLPHHTSLPTTRRHSLAIGDRAASTLLENTTDKRRLKATETRPRSASCLATTPKPMHPAKVQRWAGLTRTVSDWDHGLRRVCLSASSSKRG